MSNKADFLYATMDVAIWSCVETSIGISASAAATLRPLFRKFLERTGYGENPVYLQSRSKSQPWARAVGRMNYKRSASPGSSEYEINAKSIDERAVTKATVVDIKRIEDESP